MNAVSNRKTRNRGHAYFTHLVPLGFTYRHKFKIKWPIISRRKEQIIELSMETI